MLHVETVAARVRMWRSVRIARRVTASEVAATAEVDVRVARDFLAELAAAGRVRAGVLNRDGRVFVLAEDSAVPPPRAKTSDDLRQRVWEGMRALRAFTLEALLGIAGATLDRRAAAKYVEALTAVGYLEKVQAARGKPARWEIVRDTGPLAPTPALGWVAYDANIDRVMTREKVRRG